MKILSILLIDFDVTEALPVPESSLTTHRGRSTRIIARKQAVGGAMAHNLILPIKQA